MWFLHFGGSRGHRASVASVATLVIVVTLFGSAARCQAERVYRIVEYPAFQSGYLLEGTITTTDDAPADSLLSTEEILAWEYRTRHSAASLPGRHFTSDGTIFVTNTTAAIGVRITNSSIELPLATAERPEYVALVLGRQGFCRAACSAARRSGKAKCHRRPASTHIARSATKETSASRYGTPTRPA